MKIALSIVNCTFSTFNFQLNKMKIRGITKIIFRNIFVQRGFSLVTLIGLSLGIAMTLLVLAYVDYERSYDKHFPDSENIYRLISFGHFDDDTIQSALSPYPLSIVAEQIQGVVVATRLIPVEKRLISSDYARYNESNFFYADNNFFEVFNIPFFLGNPQTALADSNSVVISQTMSRKYFGNENPLEQELLIDAEIKFKVTGVFNDFPDNTHIHPNFIGNWSHLRKMFDENYSEWEENWFGLSIYTYMRVDSDAEFSFIKDSIDSRTSALMYEQLVEKELDKENLHLSVVCQSLQSIHLTTGIDHENEEGYDSNYINIFTGIAFLILLITAIDFMNLVTADTSHRSKEIAIRKTFGAGKQHIGFQLLLETVLASFAALVLALVFMELFAFRFSDLLDISIGSGSFITHLNIKYVILVTLLLGILAGSYPAFIFSKIRPEPVFRNKLHFAKSAIFIRGILLAVQVCIATSLISISLGINQQMSYLKTADSGFEPDRIAVVERGYVLDSDSDSTRLAIEKIDEVESVSSVRFLPYGEIRLRSFKTTSDSLSTGMMLALFSVDHNFQETMGAKLIEGRFFEENDTTNSSFAVINETARRALEINDINTQTLEFLAQHESLTIIGVISDIHIAPFTEAVRPAVYFQHNETSRKNHLFVRMKPEMMPSGIAKINDLYDSMHYKDPFTFYPLTDKLREFYRKETRFTGIDILFSFLAVVLSILGVKGFVSYIISSRRKNMEIRKIITNSSIRILFVTFKGLLIYIMIGIVGSFFISFYVLKIWSLGFYTSITPSVLCYLIPSVFVFIMMLIGAVRVGYGALKNKT